MKRFTLLKQTRQATEYSCGASSLQAILSYWGRDVDEAELMGLLGTTPEEGTYPEAIVRVAQSLGFQAELKSGLTLEEVRQATDRGEPVMMLGQVWLTGKPGDHALTDDALADEWDSGHWFIALAVDDEYVYFEDPYVRMGKGFVPRSQFEERWHNVMGGDRSKPQQIRMGIFIRGDRPVEQHPGRQIDFSGLEDGKVGSLNLLVTQFEGRVLPLDFVDDLKDVLTSGLVRHDAIIFLHRDAQGRVTAVEGGSVQADDDIAEVNAVIGALVGLVGGVDAARARALMAVNDAAGADFGLSAEELQRIANQLPPNHSAIIILFENLWELKFRDVVARHGGKLVKQRLIGYDELTRLGRQLREGARG